MVRRRGKNTKIKALMRKKYKRLLNNDQLIGHIFLTTEILSRDALVNIIIEEGSWVF